MATMHQQNLHVPLACIGFYARPLPQRARSSPARATAATPNAAAAATLPRPAVCTRQGRRPDATRARNTPSRSSSAATLRLARRSRPRPRGRRRSARCRTALAAEADAPSLAGRSDPAARGEVLEMPIDLVRHQAGRADDGHRVPRPLRQARAGDTATEVMVPSSPPRSAERGARRTCVEEYQIFCFPLPRDGVYPRFLSAYGSRCTGARRRCACGPLGRRPPSVVVARPLRKSRSVGPESASPRTRPGPLLQGERAVDGRRPHVLALGARPLASKKDVGRRRRQGRRCPSRSLLRTGELVHLAVGEAAFKVRAAGPGAHPGPDLLPHAGALHAEVVRCACFCVAAALQEGPQPRDEGGGFRASGGRSAPRVGGGTAGGLSMAGWRAVGW